MELFYEVNRHSLQNQKKITNTSNNFSTISSRNVLAFTTIHDISDKRQEKSGFFVFVCDLNVPWFCHFVTIRKFPLSALQWDKTGKYLLVSDTNGLVEVFSSEDNLINNWNSVCKVSLVGENILRAAFFHNGVKFQYNQDKKDQILYNEKYQRQKFTPSVKKFGSVAEIGCLLITSTGLIASFLIPHSSDDHTTTPKNEFGNVDVTTESLGLTRNFYTVADISYTSDGNFLIAVCNLNQKSWKSSIIHCYKVSVEKKNNSLAITSRSLSSFFPCEGSLRDCTNVEIVKLKWMSDEDSDSLMILANYSEGSAVEVWTQCEEIVPIHKLLQTNKNNCFKTVVWKNKAINKNNAKATTLITSKMGFGNNLLSNTIFVAYQDNSIICLHKEGLKRLAGVSFKGGFTFRSGHHEIESSIKQTKISSRLVSIDLTYFGHLLIVLDSIGQIYCYKCSFIVNEMLEIPQSSVTASVNLLEFCLISGLDTFDLMLALKPHLLENIIDKFTENFNRQPSSFVQYYYVKFLTMKINLQRLSTSGHSKANDLMCLLNLHSILTAFKSLLRPSDLASREKGPAENLSMILSESVPDVDKVLLNLEAKDFTVEPSTLQSLQQLIQWVADLALNILAKLPESRTFLNINKTTGDISDIMALSSIRELLVIIRIWGLLKPSCLPVFSRSTDNLDVLSILFKLLTKLGLNPNEPDEILLDECCLLPSQVLVPQLQMNVSRNSVLTSAFSHSTNYPFHFEYNLENEYSKLISEQIHIDGCLVNNSPLDSIRHIQIGRNQRSFRCTRCGAFTSSQNIGKTVAMKAWENRYTGCKCGGFWQEIKS